MIPKLIFYPRRLKCREKKNKETNGNNQCIIPLVILYSNNKYRYGQYVLNKRTKTLSQEFIVY